MNLPKDPKDLSRIDFGFQYSKCLSSFFKVHVLVLIYIINFIFSGMDMDLVILTYMDPSMLILGPMIDFGTPHPEDTRTEKTRKMERQNHKIKALERYLMLARFLINIYT